MKTVSQRATRSDAKASPLEPKQRPGPPPCPEEEQEEEDLADRSDLDSQDEDHYDEQQDDGQGPPGTGAYATLSVDGPQTTPGSEGHPENCMPCTFYCFTRRGCNRGTDCRFCHLAHKSKLQQRREAWKRQQREKRKSIRERVAAEATESAHRKHGREDRGGGAIKNSAAAAAGPTTPRRLGKVSAVGQKLQLGGDGAGPFLEAPASGRMDEPRPQRDRGFRGRSLTDSSSHSFHYSPSSVILTTGQEVDIQPQIMARPTRYRLTSSLPSGLHLDPVCGTISGAATGAFARATVGVEADFGDSTSMWAKLEVEVVDFTRGGFVVGHMSEFEPGKFMMLMYVPEEPGEGGGGGSVEGNGSNLALFDPVASSFSRMAALQQE